MPRVTKLGDAAPYPPGWEPFLAAINADLADDTPRLVFADWLQENGDEPRAQFIRLQCAAARGGDGAVAAEALRVAHWARWVVGLPKMCRENAARVGFRRGFVTALVVRGRDWAATSSLDPNWDANGKAIRRITALEEVHIEQVWNTVVESDTLQGLRGLTLASAGSALIESLAKSPALTSLVGLSILAKSSDGSSQGSFRRLLARPELAGLRRFRVESVRLKNAIPEALDAPQFANLEELRLSHLRFDAGGTQALARSPAASNLRILVLLNNPIGDTGLAHLLASPGLRNLEELDLGSCDLTPASARALAGWEGLRSVRQLNLLCNNLGRADEKRIAASPHAANLTDLWVV